MAKRYDRASLLKIGAFWTKKTKKGQTYLSGTLNTKNRKSLRRLLAQIGEDRVGMFLFKNTYRDKEKDPEKRNRIPRWYLHIVEPKESDEYEDELDSDLDDDDELEEELEDDIPF